MNILQRWLARRDPRRQQPHESREIWQTRRLAERSDEHHPELGPRVHPTPIDPLDPNRKYFGQKVTGLRITR